MLKVAEISNNLLRFSKTSNIFSKIFQMTKVCKHVQNERNFQNMSELVDLLIIFSGKVVQS